MSEDDISLSAINEPDPPVRRGFVAAVELLPKCDLAHLGGCDADGARFDFKTIYGPWANACRTHYLEARAYVTLGTGKGQRLVVESASTRNDSASAGIDSERTT